MTLPGTPHIAYRGDRLFVEGCALDDLADRFGSPLYVYSRTSILDSLSGYQRALVGRDHLIAYSVKANSSLAVLQTLNEAGAGFDIVSGGELERVIAAGIDVAKVVFSGVGKTRAEMQRALEAGVMCLNVESEAELETLSEVASRIGRTAHVSLRVNPDVDAGTHPYISTGLKGNKFGVSHERALATYLRAAALPGLKVVGIDCHIGSQITQSGPYLDALDRVLDLVEQLEANGLRIEHVDLGGGLGITYRDEVPPPTETLVRELLARIDARGHGHRRILFEPGRSIVGNAGVLVGEVLFLKPGDAKNFCIADIAMNDMMRPTMYQAWMQVAECTRRDEAAQVWDVVGPICESGDWLAHDRGLSLQQGDRIAMLSAGAYGMTMASNYNTRPRAAEVMVSGDEAWLIRERESVKSLFAGERLLPR